MEIKFHSKLKKDLLKIKDKKTLKSIDDFISFLKLSENIQDITNVKKLIGYNNYYRIRFGDYRLGFRYEEGKIVLGRFLHRKDIYKYYP